MKNSKKRVRSRILCNLLCEHIDRNQVAQKLGLEIKNGESIFDMLVNSRNAEDKEDAIILLSIMYPPSGGGTWKEFMKNNGNFKSH